MQTYLLTASLLCVASLAAAQTPMRSLRTRDAAAAYLRRSFLANDSAIECNARNIRSHVALRCTTRRNNQLDFEHLGLLIQHERRWYPILLSDGLFLQVPDPEDGSVEARIETVRVLRPSEDERIVAIRVVDERTSNELGMRPGEFSEHGDHGHPPDWRTRTSRSKSQVHIVRLIRLNDEWTATHHGSLLEWTRLGRTVLPEGSEGEACEVASYREGLGRIRFSNRGIRIRPPRPPEQDVCAPQLSLGRHRWEAVIAALRPPAICQP